MDLEKGGFGERKVVRVIKGGVVDVGVDIGKGCGRLGEVLFWDWEGWCFEVGWVFGEEWGRV